MKAIVLAAGYATRLYPLTLNQAKPLLPVKNRPMLDYIVDQIETIPNIDQILVVSNDRFYDQFAAWAELWLAGRTSAPCPDLHVLNDGSTSEDNRLGAIGDIQFCIEQTGIDDDLLVIAGDNLFTYNLIDAWKYFNIKGDDMIMATHMPESTDLSRYAVARLDTDGFVVDLVEKPACPKSDIAVFATYFYRRDTVPLFKQYLSEGNSPDAPGHFPAWLYKRKPVRAFLFDGLCIDIGTKSSYEDVRTTFPVVLQSRTAPETQSCD